MANGLICLTFLSVILLFAEPFPVLSSSVKTCIINCGQCKKMFGDYFQGRMCAEECIKTGGLLVPDCNEPSTIYRYLARIA